MKQGKLSLREVSKRKAQVEFSEREGWVKEALKRAAPHPELIGMSAEAWADASTCQGETEVELLEPEYTVQGNFSARVPILCPRCGEEGTAPRAGDFRLFVRPLGPREVVEEGDDPDYIFLETPWLDLIQMLSEQIVAAEPSVEYPDLDPHGQPHECSPLGISPAGEVISLSVQAGQNAVKAGNSPFAVLGNLKPSKRGK